MNVTGVWRIKQSTPDITKLGDFEYIDLVEQVTGAKGEFILIKVEGKSIDGNIKSGDFLIVHPELRPTKGSIVLFSANNDFFIETYKSASAKGLRVAKTIDENTPLFLGVATHRIQELQSN